MFVDGRYTIQAKSQSGKNFNVIEIHKKKLWDVLNHNIKIGYNPFCFTSLSLSRYFKNYFKLVPIYTDLFNLKISKRGNNKFYLIEDSITGEKSRTKIKRVLKFLSKDEVGLYFCYCA